MLPFHSSLSIQKKKKKGTLYVSDRSKQINTEKRPLRLLCRMLLVALIKVVRVQ